MNPQNEDIQDYLDADGGLSLTTATNLFTNNEPTEPDKCVTLYNTPDAGPQLFLDEEDGDTGDDRYEYVGLQVRVRDNSENDAAVLSGQILGVLHNKGNIVINDTLYTLIQALDSPTKIDTDAKKRAIVVTNYHIQRCPNKS